MKNLLHDLRYSWNAFMKAWKFTRYMRNGGNPDIVQF
jgi:diacylglycerol kinase